MKKMNAVMITTIVILFCGIGLLGWQVGDGVSDLVVYGGSVATTGVRGTYSMLPMIYPDAELEYIPFEGELLCGHVYIYDSPVYNELVVHRFVYEMDNGSLIFLGDNNGGVPDDPIAKEDVLYEVIGVKI